jgi:hypothetical protein
MGWRRQRSSQALLRSITRRHGGTAPPDAPSWRGTTLTVKISNAALSISILLV